MAKFVSEVAVFVLIAFVVSFIRPLYLLRTGEYQDMMIGADVYHAISNSRRSTTARTLVVGDSVAYQLFNTGFEDKSVQSLASNQAISLAGQYILARQFMDSNPQVTHIVLVLHPNSFRNNLDNHLTYRYFVKPFYRDEFMPDMTDTVHRRMDAIPLVWLASWPQVRAGDWAPDVPRVDDRPKTYWFSEIAREYLAKFVDLARRHDASLSIVAPPLSMSRSDLTSLNSSDAGSAGVQRLIRQYKATVQKVPDDEFWDGVHYNDPSQQIDKYLAHLRDLGLPL